MKRRSIARWGSALLAWCVCASGCAAVMTNPLGGGYRSERSPRCSASVVPPLADLVAGSVMAVVVPVQVKRENMRGDAVYWTGEPVALAAVAVGLLGSAIYGWRQVERCDNARDAHQRWLDQRVATPMDGGGHAR